MEPKRAENVDPESNVEQTIDKTSSLKNALMIGAAVAAVVLTIFGVYLVSGEPSSAIEKSKSKVAKPEEIERLYFLKSEKVSNEANFKYEWCSVLSNGTEPKVHWKKEDSSSITTPYVHRDSKKIAFSRFLNSKWFIHVMDLEAEKLNANIAKINGESVSFCPDGKKIVYVEGENIKIYDLETNAIQVLPNDYKGELDIKTSTVFSNDGKSIFYKQLFIDDKGSAQLRKVDLSSPEKIEIIETLHSDTNSLLISPEDDNLIAYVSQGAKGREIFVKNVKTKILKDFEFPGVQGGLEILSWSSNGKLIYYSRKEKSDDPTVIEKLNWETGDRTLVYESPKE